MARATKSAVKAEETEDNKVNVSKIAAFEEAIKRANKEIGSETGTLIAKLSDKPMEVETISTGSAVLDSITGGGFPKGRLIEIYGTEASGKTSIALIAVGNVQKNGGTAAYIDLENALDPRYARKLGVDTDALAVSQPEYAEQALNLVYLLASSGVVDLIVLDSIASLLPKAELEGDMEQQSMALLARLMSKALRKLIGVANKTNTTIIFINQVREAVGAFSMRGTPTNTSGGRAMKFYASQRIEVRRKDKVVEGTETIGNIVHMTVRKNKIAPPFGEGETVLTFNKGINLAAELIESAPKWGVIERPNARRYVNALTGEVIGTSRKDAIETLEKDEKQMLAIKEAMMKAITDNMFENNGSKQETLEEDSLNNDNEEIEDKETDIFSEEKETVEESDNDEIEEDIPLELDDEE